MTDTAEGLEAKILYADDTEAQRYAVSRILRRAGFQVVEAGTGQKALELSAHAPDLILLDVNLPDISGIEVCKRIKANSATARIPVLQVSATAVTTEARVAGLEGGADAYLVQPLQAEELVATVRALLRAQRTEEKLWEFQLQYRLFFEANPLPCCVFDTSDRRILAVNTAAIQSYGYSREEFTGLSVLDLLAENDRQTAIAFFSDSDHSDQEVWTHKTKLGQLRHVEMVEAPLELNGRRVQLIIITDVTEKLEREAAKRDEEIRRLLLDRTFQVQEDERRRIARELHDEAGQLLTSLLVGLRSLSDARRLTDTKAQSKRLRQIASDAIQELGRLARGLHPSVLDDLGFETALRRYADEFSATHPIGLEIDFGEAGFESFSRDDQLNLYRIVQEALTNVARHSRAKHVRVTFRSSLREIVLTIRDDGCGLAGKSSVAGLSPRLGIAGMRQRAVMLGGTLEVGSEPQQGVCVEVKIPRKPFATRSKPA